MICNSCENILTVEDRGLQCSQCRIERRPLRHLLDARCWCQPRYTEERTGQVLYGPYAPDHYARMRHPHFGTCDEAGPEGHRAWPASRA